MRPRLSLTLALFASALLLALGVVSFHRETAHSKPVVPPFELFACTQDSDCAVVKRIGCCPCSEGGAQAAVTRWRRDDLRRFLKGACRDATQVCVQVDLCRDNVSAACVERRCTLAYGNG